MKTIFNAIFAILFTALCLSCESDNTVEKPATYQEYLSNKIILSIKIYDDAVWVYSTCVCDTCYVAPHMSSIPYIEQLTLIKNNDYDFDEPSAFSMPQPNSKGELYVSTYNALFKVNALNDYTQILETGDFTFRSFAFDNDDNIWFYGDKGLAYWNKSELEFFTVDNSELPSNRVHSLCIDNSGTVWVALDFAGVLKIESGKWSIIPNADIPGLNEYSYVYNLLATDNAIWFQVHGADTTSNILKYEDKNWVYEFPESTPVFKIEKDSRGSIWSISNSFEYNDNRSTSLKYYENNSWVSFNTSDISSKVLTVNSSNEKIYIGTANGLIEKLR